MPNRQIKLESLDLLISLIAGKHGVGLFVGAIDHSDFEESRDQLFNHLAALETALDVEIGNGEKHSFVCLRVGNYADETQSDELIDWKNQMAEKYDKALVEILGK